MPDSGAKEGNSGLSAFLTSSVESMQRWARLRGKVQKLQTAVQLSDKEPGQPSDVYSLVPCGEVVGCLAVCVTLCKHFTSKFDVQQNTNLLLRITVNGIMKCTNPQILKVHQRSYLRDVTVNFGDVKYFSIQVPRQRQDMQNKIILELVEFQSPKEFPKLLGYATVHLYEVIQRSHFTETLAMRSRNIVVCTLEVEFTFCYGSFGYGYSHQLKQPEPELQKTIKRSMFLRIPPLKDRRDRQSVIAAQFLGYPAFSSPDQCVADGTVEREISSPGVSSKGLGILQNGLKKIPPRNRLEKMKNEYRTLKTWDKRAEYLDELIMKKGPKMTTGQHMNTQQKRHFTSRKWMKRGKKLLGKEAEAFLHYLLIQSYRERICLKQRISEQVLKTTEKMHHGDSSEYAESDQKLHPLPAVVITSTSTVSQKSLIRNPEENWERTSSVCFKPMDSEYVIAVVPDWEIELGRKPNTEKLSVLEPTKADLIHLEDYPVIHSQDFASGISERARISPQVSVTSESEPVIILSDPSGKTVKKLQQFPLKEIEYQQPVLSGDKFEPFLRHIGRTQSTVYERKEAGLEAPIFSVLENKPLCADVKEEDDQDPPIGTPSTKVTSSSAIELSKSCQRLSILRLIESNMKLEEEQKDLSLLNVKEPLLLTINTNLPEKWQEKRLSETEIMHPNIFLNNALEDFLVDRLINIITLKSVLSSSLGEMISERLSEIVVDTKTELEEEYQNLQCFVDGSSVVLERDLLEKGQNYYRLSEPETIHLKAVLSQNLQDRLIERFSETGIITDLELGKQHQNLPLQGIKDMVRDMDLDEKIHNYEKTASEPEIVDLKPVLKQNLQDFAREGLLELGLMLSNDARQPKSEAESSEKSKDQSGKQYSETEIRIIKSLSENLQDLPDERFLESGLIKVTELEHECPNLTSQFFKDRQSIDEKGTKCFKKKSSKTEKIKIESALSQNLQDYMSESCSERGMNTEIKLGKEQQNGSLQIIKVKLPVDLETEVPRREEDHHKQRLTKQEINLKSASDKTLQDTFIEKLLETEIMSLKTFLNQCLQEKLSETRLVTEEKLENVQQNHSLQHIAERQPRITETDLPDIGQVHPSESLTKQHIIKGRPILNGNIQDFLLEALSQREIMNLKSILSKKIQNHFIERFSEIGVITEEELRKIYQSLFVLRANERLSNDMEVNLPKEEQSLRTKSLSTKKLQDRLSETQLVELKSLLNKIMKEGCKDRLSETEVKSLKSVLSTSFQDLPVENISVELESTCQNTSLKNGEGKPLTVTDKNIFESRQDHAAENLNKMSIINEKPILRKEKCKLPVDNISEQVCAVVNLNKETQTNSLRTLPQKGKNYFERETQVLQSCLSNTEKTYSKTDLEKALKPKHSDDSLRGTPETVALTSFLSSHDTEVQTELKEYLSKSMLSFPASPPTFIFLRSDSDREAKASDKSCGKAKGKKKHINKVSRKCTVPYQGQVVMGTQFKEEKQTDLHKSKEGLKGKHKKHPEAGSQILGVSGSKKDSKCSMFSYTLNKENSKQKAEQEKRHESRSKKLLSKSIKVPSATKSEQQLKRSANVVQEESSPSSFPRSWRAKRNISHYTDREDIDVELFKHLEKAVKRALRDLGKAPEDSTCQPLHSVRPHTAPDICNPTEETSKAQPARSCASSLDSFVDEDTGHTTSSESENLDSPVEQVEITPEKWEVVCKVLQKILQQNWKPKKDS
ncbi:C2 calcium-dependent domain-containing protein 6 isoform X3 [Alligator sinensis]|uniref:C2 calcium-dependent domain-containing protein 6 isoform X3 n=1 Tax=Alligator sinensis TaxID=38654 RepID=A0A3Q0FYZ1_ALLSI|nr:C2 calcium-dependent domain-containing protein 6 isoform X3 [Alligator sinensis]